MGRTRVAAVALVVAALLSGCGTSTTPQVARARPPAQQCPEQQSAVLRALDRSTTHVDVTGDGRPDTVATVTAPGAPKPCRGIVAVRVAGDGVLSQHLIAAAVPMRGIRASVIGLPHLTGHAGAEVVVDTGAAADAILAQMFTVVDGRLRAMRVPDQPAGTFIVVGGGLMYPHGAGCTASGRLVLLRAAQTLDGKRFRVVRRTFTVAPDGVRFTRRSITRATVPVKQLSSRFPEFAGSHWQACTAAPS